VSGIVNLRVLEQCVGHGAQADRLKRRRIARDDQHAVARPPQPRGHRLDERAVAEREEGLVAAHAPALAAGKNDTDHGPSIACGDLPRVSGPEDGSVAAACGARPVCPTPTGGVRMEELQARRVLKEFGIQVTQFMGRRRELREQAASAIEGEDRASVAAVLAALVHETSEMRRQWLQVTNLVLEEERHAYSEMARLLEQAGRGDLPAIPPLPEAPA